MPSKPNTSLRAFDTLPLGEARTHLTNLAETAGVIPTHAYDSVMSTVDELCESAETLGITTLGGMCASAAAVLQHVASIDKVGGPLATANADRLHRYRNVALALALACAYYLDVNAPTVIDYFKPLWPRTHRTERPHTDDEVTLLRVYVVDQLRRPASTKAAGIYAMVDAGAAPVETTGITSEEFDTTDDGEPTFMLIPRYTQAIEDRAVDLDRFASYVLGCVLRRAHSRKRATDAPLTYDQGTGSRYSPSASVSGIIRRVHEAVGLKHPDTTPASTRRWRIQTTFNQHGLDAAVAISGQPEDRLGSLIDLPKPPDTAEAPKVKSFL